jgi:hypothetical protein
MRQYLLIGLLLFCVSGIYADPDRGQEPDRLELEINAISPAFHREYNLGLGVPYDLSNAAINARTAGKALIDVYYRGIAPQVRSPLARDFIGSLWSFTVCWSSAMWPHELGHFLRVKQVGGDFWIEKIAFPVAFGAVRFPAGSSLEDELLFVIGGLEVNSLMALGIQQDNFRYNGLYNDELYTALFHRLMFPAYTWLFAPIDPADPGSWKNENDEQVSFGDVASMARLVLERQGKSVLLGDGSVNPELVSFYQSAKLWSLLWNLADINLYYQLTALFRGELAGTNPPYVIGDARRGWSYGTLFNATVLGVELLLNNYVNWDGRHYRAYLKYGFPLTDYGMGIGFLDIFSESFLDTNLEIHAWHQEYYGTGFAIGADLDIPLSKNLYARFRSLWKLEGYLLGTPLQQGLSGYIGLKYKP